MEPRHVILLLEVSFGIFNYSEKVKVHLAYFDVLRKNMFMESG
jgi:hypothetical protein